MLCDLGHLFYDVGVITVSVKLCIQYKILSMSLIIVWCALCNSEPNTDHRCYAYGNSGGNVPQSWAQTDTGYTQWVSLEYTLTFQDCNSQVNVNC